jgi:hypothetical protein
MRWQIPSKLAVVHAVFLLSFNCPTNAAEDDAYVSSHIPFILIENVNREAEA